MQPVPRPKRSVHPVLARIFRLAALLAWVGQLAVLGAPFVEASAGATTAPHVESHSNPLHHAHNPDLCPGCAAIALVGLPVAGRSPIPDGAVVVSQPAREKPRHARDRLTAAARPRAPPVRESVTRSFPRFQTDSHTLTTHAFRTLAVRAPGERGGHRAGAAA